MYRQVHTPSIQPFIHNVMSLFSFWSAVLPASPQPFSKPGRNFSKRNNSHHCMLLPSPHSRWSFTWQKDRWTTQKASIPASYSDVSHCRTLSPSGRRKDNVVVQLVSWFMLRSCRAFSSHFVKWMCDGFWQTVRQNLTVALPCCTQD